MAQSCRPSDKLEFGLTVPQEWRGRGANPRIFELVAMSSREYEGQPRKVSKVNQLAILEPGQVRSVSILLEPDPHSLVWLKPLGLLFAQVKTAAVVVVHDGEPGKVVSFE